MKKEFISIFQITKMTTFEVEYYTLSNNKNADFKTSANHFVRNKRDYDQCGQAQKDLLPGHKTAWEFYNKWDKKHLRDLTQKEYDEMITDLEKLKSVYNYMYRELDETKKPYSPHFRFSEVVELSKQELKTKK